MKEFREAVTDVVDATREMVAEQREEDDVIAAEAEAEIAAEDPTSLSEAELPASANEATAGRRGAGDEAIAAEEEALLAEDQEAGPEQPRPPQAG